MWGAGLWGAPGGWQGQSGLEVPLGPVRAGGAPRALSPDFLIKFLFSETFVSSRHVNGLLLPLPSALPDLAWLWELTVDHTCSLVALKLPSL